MLENRPQLRNHLFATAILFGTAVAGASTLDFMLTSGFQFPTAQAEAASHTPYAGDPRYVWDPPSTAPASFSGDLYEDHFQEVSHTPDTPPEALEGDATRGNDSEDEPSALYREIAALYADEPIEEDLAPDVEPHPVYDALTEYAADIKQQASGNEQPS